VGMQELADAIFDHREYLQSSDILKLRSRERLLAEFDHLLRSLLLADWQQTHSQEQVDAVLEQVYSRRLSPRQAVERLL